MPKQATYMPSVKPKVGMRVGLTNQPGQWQVISQAPDRGTWWLVALDDTARAASTLRGNLTPQLGGGYEKATADYMTRA
jgi:hypothetical protein